MTRATLVLFASLIFAGQFLVGCIAASVGLGAGAVVAHQEERGIGGFIGDTEIRLGITNQWLRGDRSLAGDLGLMIYGGRVLVTGITHDEAARDRAIALAWRPRGVREVIDEVVIGAPRSLATIAADQIITKKLQTKMLFNSEVGTINYNRRTVDGTVYILGVAEDQAELNRIIEIAHNISGVKNVVSHVIVRGEVGAARIEHSVGPLAGTTSVARRIAWTAPPRLGRPVGDPLATQGPVTTTTLPDIGSVDRVRRTYLLTDHGEPIPLTGAIAAGPQDTEIRFKINELWHESDPRSTARLGLLVHGARVVITGFAATDEARAEPYRLAWQVSGVREVYNEIRVGPSPGRAQVATDRHIESQMLARMQSEFGISAARFAVRADGGHLFLLGTARSPGERAQIESIARSLDGVAKIVSHVVPIETASAIAD